MTSTEDVSRAARVDAVTSSPSGFATMSRTAVPRSVSTSRTLRAFAAAIASLLLASAFSAQASLTSDKLDYAPGENAVLTGAGFEAFEFVTMQVVHADGSPVIGAQHDWGVQADAAGAFVTNWLVCNIDCVGATLIASAYGESSGAQADTTFTDALPCGTGVATITSVNNSCVAFTTSQNGATEFWNVAEGETYLMTIRNVTEWDVVSNPNITYITVFFFNQGTGIHCINLPRISTYDFEGTFTMPSPACYSYVIAYTCGTTKPCDQLYDALAARGPSNVACNGVALRTSYFDEDCNLLGVDTDCDPCTPCTLTCPPDTMVECGTSTAPAVTGMATGCTNVTYSDEVVAGACGGASTILRTWSAPDGCGGTATCVQVITVVDTTPPMITCPPDKNLDCSDSTDPSATGVPTASDGCSGVTVDYDDDVLPGSCANNFVITRTWTATDGCGNSMSCDQILTVSDTTAPMITCPGPITVECEANVPPCDPSQATAFDDCSIPTVTCTDGPLVGGACGGTITRTYTATDACGNVASCTQIITVSDTTPPVISCPTGCTEIECRVPFLFSVSATDNCDPDPAISYTVNAVDPSLVVVTDLGGGMYTIELLSDTACGDVSLDFMATDDCGNSVPCSFQFSCADHACRLTGGGNVLNKNVPNSNSWTMGGQAGAPTAYQPQPCGEWTHHQKKGPDGSFIFHGGTASAPQGTYISKIVCSDPGPCTPSGNPPSPVKDVDFDGVGSFKNLKLGRGGMLAPYAPQIIPGETLHWFEVHVEDLGEPGGGGHFDDPGPQCPPEGTPNSVGDCSCPDYYSIRIYLLPEPPHAMNPLIYEAHGYLEGGNFQTHSPTNGSTCGGKNGK